MGSRASHISFWALSLDPGSHYTPFKYPEIYDNKALAVMRVYNPMSKVSSPVEGTQWLCPCSAVTFCRPCWSGQSFSCLQFRMEKMSLQKDKGMKCSMEYFGIGTVNMSRVWPKELNTSQSTNGVSAWPNLTIHKEIWWARWALWWPLLLLSQLSVESSAHFEA